MQPFSVFLPVYNEETLLVSNTEKLLKVLAKLKTPFEIILGSNGSTDQTRSLGQKLQETYSNVRFFHLRRKGTGHAFKKAIALMRYKQLICLDMDLSVDLDFVEKALVQLKKSNIVIGSKKLGVENRTWVRRIGSDSFIACSKWLLGIPYDDYSIGAKAYSKPVLDHFAKAIGQGTFYVQYMVFWALQDGFKVVQIPVDCMDHRKSRFSLIWEGAYRFLCLGLLWFSGRVLVRRTKVANPAL